MRRQSDFSYIRETGRNWAGRYLVVQAAEPRGDDAGWRVAIVVSRYFSPRAVERNRAKRLLREACRQELPGLIPAWLVIRPRYPIKKAKLGVVAHDLRKSLGRVGVLANPDP